MNSQLNAMVDHALVKEAPCSSDFQRILLDKKQELLKYRYSFCFLLLVLLASTSSKKIKTMSFQIGSG